MSDKNFSRFGHRFQETLVSCMIRDRPFCDQLTDVLNINFLELKQLQVIVKALYEYKLRYKLHPAPETLEMVLREEHRQNEGIPAYKQALEFVQKTDNIKELSDDRFVKDTALDFCRKQALGDAILKSVDLLNSSSFEQIQKIINDAMKLGVSQDFGHDFHKDFEKRHQTSSRLFIPTPWDEFNQILGGGFGRGELHIVVSNTGGGKSHTMIDFGAHAMSLGYNGVHFTLELRDIATGKRYDSRISGVDINVASQNKEYIKQCVSDCPGQLIIREWPTKSASTNTIRAHLDRLITTGFKIDFVIVDYADLLKSLNKTGEKRTQLEEINEELRGIAQEYNVVLINASQSNRSAFSGKTAGDSDMITMESINESYGKCFPADFIWTLSRNKKDKDQGMGKFFVAKNRNGPDGYVYKVMVDTSTSTFKVLPPSSEPLTSDHETGIITDRNTLKNVYNKMKGQ